MSSISGSSTTATRITCDVSIREQISARIRARVASELGVAVEEIALTRGATEALQALIGGYNRLRPGDAVLYADLDYDSMQAAMNWFRVSPRCRRREDCAA